MKQITTFMFLTTVQETYPNTRIQTTPTSLPLSFPTNKTTSYLWGTKEMQSLTPCSEGKKKERKTEKVISGLRTALLEVVKFSPTPQLDSSLPSTMPPLPSWWAVRLAMN